MVDERPAGHAAQPGEDGQHAVGQAGLRAQLAEAEGGERRLLGRLEHGRVAEGQGGRHLQGRHDQRVVPGDDARAHAEGLAHGPAHPVVGRGVGGAVGLGGVAGVVAEGPGGHHHVGLGLGQGLAHVEHLELGQLGGVGLDRRRHLAQQDCPGVGVQARPAAVVDRGAGGGHRRVDLGGPGRLHLGQRLAGGGVEGHEALGRAALAAAGDAQLVRAVQPAAHRLGGRRHGGGRVGRGGRVGAAGAPVSGASTVVMRGLLRSGRGRRVGGPDRSRAPG